MAADLTSNEILEAIRLAIKDNPDQAEDGVLTIRELTERMHISPMLARRGVSRLLATGEIEIIKTRRTRYDGIVYHTNGFRPKQ